MPTSANTAHTLLYIAIAFFSHLLLHFDVAIFCAMLLLHVAAVFTLLCFAGLEPKYPQVVTFFCLQYFLIER
jgi:hypothetical protein